MQESKGYLGHLAAALMIIVLSVIYRGLDGIYAVFGVLIGFVSLLAAMLGVFRYLKEYIEIVFDGFQNFKRKAEEGFEHKEEK